MKFFIRNGLSRNELYLTNDETKMEWVLKGNARNFDSFDAAVAVAKDIQERFPTERPRIVDENDRGD